MFVCVFIKSFTSPNIDDEWWIKTLNLYIADKKCIKKMAPLRDSVINAAQMLLKFQYPHISGFQSTLTQNDIEIVDYPAI